MTNKPFNDLQLVLMLTDGHSYTAHELGHAMNVSRRQVYNRLATLRRNGFVVVHCNGRYYLDSASPFFRTLVQSLNFSEPEARCLHDLLDAADADNPLVNATRRKLERFYHLDEDNDTPDLAHQVEVMGLLRQAIDRRCIVCLHHYSSPHSHTVTDRVVEPFMLLNNHRDVRCYELTGRMNKTFKLARIGSVELYDAPWLHADKHREQFTDIFMFSGEQRYPVQLRMGQLSHNLMLEEYPASAHCFSPEADGWLFAADVASFAGIGRFVLGLYHDIEVLGGDAFRAYLQTRLREMQPSGTEVETQQTV